MYAETNTINRNRPDRFAAKTIKGTRQLHAVKPSEPGTLAVRQLSCFCAGCQFHVGECSNLDVVDNWKTETIHKKLSKTRSELSQKEGTDKPKIPQKDGTEKPKVPQTKVPQKDVTEKPEKRENRKKGRRPRSRSKTYKYAKRVVLFSKTEGASKL